MVNNFILTRGAYLKTRERRFSGTARLFRDGRYKTLNFVAVLISPVRGLADCQRLSGQPLGVQAKFALDFGMGMNTRFAFPQPL